MKIQFISLKAQEFKGIVEPMEVSFSPDVTVIHGPNRSGKTTILDAIYWCLFGKTLTGEARFGILPMDKQSGVPTVSLTLQIDGEIHTLTRRQINGATACLIDNAPKQLKEYNLWVDTNMMPVERFKVFSNPVHFASLPQKEQRDLFMRFFTKPVPKEVYARMEKDGVALSPQYTERAKRNTPQEIIDQVRGKGNVQGELVVLEKRQAADVAVADHLTREMQANPSMAVDKLEAEREKILVAMNGTNEKIEAYRKKQAERDEWIRNQRNEINYTQSAIDLERAKLERATNEAASEKMGICAKINGALSGLRDEWARLAKQQTPDMCPTCKRAFPADDVEAAKTAVLTKQHEIEQQAEKLKAESEAAHKEYEAISNAPIVKSAHLIALEATMEELKAKLKEKLEEPQAAAPTNGYDEQRKRLDEITSALGNNAAFERNAKQFEEIKGRMEGTAREIQMCKRLLEDAGQCIKYEALITVEQVNQQFEHVHVELFEILSDGTPKDKFLLTMDGKDYNDLSSTERIMAGLEINAYLKNALAVSVPTIIDNFESYQSIGMDGLIPQAIVAVASGNELDELIVEPYALGED